MKNTFFTLVSGLMLCSMLCLEQSSASAQTTTQSNPIFAKGKMTMDQFFNIYLRYPEIAIQNKTEGTVMVGLTIDTDGEPTNINLVAGIDSLLNAEALRVVNLFPYYTPAKENGKSIKTKVKIPVRFKLHESEEIATEVLPQAIAKNPLYVIDDKIVVDDLKVNAEDIESIRVIKGPKAIEKYGERARDGAIVIRTKQITSR